MTYELRTPEQMDAAADLAEAEIGDGQDYTVTDIANWWKR